MKPDDYDSDKVDNVEDNVLVTMMKIKKLTMMILMMKWQ